MRSALAVTALLVLSTVALADDPLALEVSRTIDLGEGDTDAVRVADFDGDGDPDVARVTRDEGGVTVLLNDGRGIFTALPRVATDFYIENIEAADLDGDGAADLVATALGVGGGQIMVISSEDTGVLVFLNDGEGRLELVATAIGCDVWEDPQIGDLDGDGDPDVAWCRYHYDEPHGVATLVNDGEGGFTEGPIAETPEAVENLRLADLTGDGLLDICGTLFPLPESIFLENLGDLAFGPAPAPPPPTGGSGTGTVGRWQSYPTTKPHNRGQWRGDVDGDGDVDALRVGFANHVSVFLKEADGDYGRNHEYSLGEEDLGAVHLVAVDDFDGDGATDILVHAAGGTRLLSPGGEVPPTIDAVEGSTVVRAGDRYVFEAVGSNLTKGTLIDFGEENEVVATELLGPDRLRATVDVARWGHDDPGRATRRLVDVKVENRTGGSSTRISGIGIEPYWTTGMRLEKGLLVDAKKAGRDRFQARGEFGMRGQWGDFFSAPEAGLRLVFGDQLAPYELVIPPGDPGWEVVRETEEERQIRWQGATPKIRIDLRRPKNHHKWDFRFTLKGFDFPAPQIGAVRAELYVGDLRAAGTTHWKAAGKGRFRAEKDR